MSDRPIRVFVSYSHCDDEYLRRDSLLGFLSGLRHVGVEFWTDREIPPGAAWDATIRDQISKADIALLLVSQAFLDSEYVRDEEIRLVLERRRSQGLVVVPVLLSPCDWPEYPWLSALQFLPRDGKTLKEDYQDEGARLRLYSQLRSELSEHVQRIRSRRAQQDVKASGERRWIATACCELRLVSDADIDPGDEIEAIHRCFSTLEALAHQVVQRFDGQLTVAAPEIRLHFGYPAAHEDDACRAVMAALTLMQQVACFPPDVDAGARFALRAGVDLTLTVVDPNGRITGKCNEEADRLRLSIEREGVGITGRMVRLVRNRVAVQPMPAGGGFWVGTEATLKEFAGAERPFMLGRDPEHALLQRHWARATDGQGGLVLVRGERGIGKTRLLEAFQYALRPQPHRTIVLRCSPFHDNRPLHPLHELLNHLLGEMGAVDPSAKRRALSAMLVQDGLDESIALPAIERLLDLHDTADADALNASNARRDLLEALCSWMLALSDRQPLLLAIEDVQWIDPSTADLVGALLDFIPDARALAIATTVAEVPAAWTSKLEACVIELDRLGNAHVETMVSTLDTEHRIRKHLVSTICRATDGIPLYVEEYVGMLLEGTEPSALPAGVLGSVPAALSGIMAQRLDAAGDAKPCAQLGSTLGYAFDQAQFVAVAQRARMQTPTQDLDDLVRVSILRSQGRPGRKSYAFRHGLLRDAAYDSLLGQVRKQYHGFVADQLLSESSAAIDAALVAHHLTLAGRKAEAVPYWHRAARTDIARSTNREAASNIECALRLIPAVSESDRGRLELALRLDYGTVLVALQGYAAPTMDANYKRARELSKTAGDARQSFAALWGAWSYYIVSGDFATALELANEIERVATKVDDRGLLIERHHVVGVTRFNLGQFESAVAELDAGLDLCQASDDNQHALTHGQDAAVALNCWRALCLSYLGDFMAAQQTLARALERAERLCHQVSRIMALTFSGIVNDATRDRALACVQASRASMLAEEQDCVYWRAWADFVSAAADWEHAKVPEALGKMERAVRTYESTGAKVWLPYMLLRLAAGLAQTQQLEQANTVAETGMQLLGNARQRYYAAEVLAWRAQVAAATGASERELLQEAWSVALQQKHRAAALQILTIAGQSRNPQLRDDARVWADALLSDATTANLAEWRVAVASL